MRSKQDQAAPEKQLLIACARRHMTRAAEERIREISAGRIDWEYLLRVAAENGALPLLSLHLPEISNSAFSSEQFEELKLAARAAGLRSLHLSAELVRVVEALCSEKIAVWPYKGPVIAMQAYGDLALRTFEDLDIIVLQRDIYRAHGVLSALKYQPRFPWVPDESAPVPSEYSYYDPERRIIVELHTELTLRHFPVVPDLGEMAGNAVNVSIGGHAVHTFGPEDTLVLLCVHGSKDFWERISWITDVSEFVQRNQELDWERVFARAKETRATRMVLLGLALAEKLLDAPLPDAVCLRVEADSNAVALATQIAERAIARELPVWRAREAFRFRRKLVPGAIASWRYGLRLATAPAEEDWRMLRLPRALSPFYAVLRPLRLLRKYGGAAALFSKQK
jgi:Uncharacterised nucleotidyltransferase